MKRIKLGFFVCLLLCFNANIFYYRQSAIRIRARNDHRLKEMTNENEDQLQQTSFDFPKLEEKLNEKLKIASKRKLYIVYLEPPFGNKEVLKLDSQECGLCEVTHNKALIDHPDAKAVIAHYAELPIVKFPKVRRLDQYYVFQSMESTATMHNFGSGHFFKRYDNVFNLTMTHRLDSDIWNPYGNRYLAITTAQNQHQKEALQGKRKLALWVVSNCLGTRGAIERMKYVHSLIKDGLQIDLGGKCFPWSGVTDWKFSDYKFYFAFENSVNCKDYITEKFFHNALKSMAVPVVYGTRKSDYELIAPPNSFIYAKDYSNKELIDLLNYLDRNETAYMKYFKWRQIPISSLADRRRKIAHCQLCRILHGINYDYIFHRNYEKDFRKLTLFPENLPIRVVESLSHFVYDKENSGCVVDPVSLLESVSAFFYFNIYPINLAFLILFIFLLILTLLMKKR